MSTTPWTVKRTKRKSPSTDPNPRKRIRISDDVAASKSTVRKARNQQTLTQISWADNPQRLAQDDSDLQEIGIARKKRARSRSSGRRGLVKRDSTLTQLDWLGGFHVHQDQDEEDMSMLPDNKEDLIQTSIPQADGAEHGQPKETARWSGDVESVLQNKSSSPVPYETQDYRPARSIKRATATEKEKKALRRRSSRIAQKALPDAEDGQAAKETPSPKRSTQKALSGEKLSSPTENPADILNEKIGEEQPLTEPRTPRRRFVVPSSQTPETILKSKRSMRHVDKGSPSRSSGRTPLRERSTNIQTRTYSQGLEKSNSLLGIVDKSPRKRKICVLKAPTRELLRRSAPKDEDPQPDVFSLPMTSSSDQNNESSDPVESTKPPTRAFVQHDTSVEIPGTSEPRESSDSELPSSPPTFPLDESLPALTDLIPTKQFEAQFLPEPGDRIVHNQAGKQSSAIVQDLGEINEDQEITPRIRQRTPLPDQIDHRDEEMLLDDNGKDQESQLQVTTHNDVDVVDNDSDFGSPVANDTQFNVNLNQRTSSPSVIAASTDMSHADDPKVTPSKPSKLGRLRKKSPVTDRRRINDTEIDSQTPLPVPRLVQNTSPSPRLLQLTSERTQDDGPQLPSSDGYVTVSTEILSDKIPSPPSSPQTLPQARPITQGSIHPASMPRPSQMSTQVPTQSYFPSSAPAYTQQRNEVERITIKDSSSVPPRLSQVPTYDGRSQHQGLGSQYTNNWDDGFDDLDLDPTSTIPQARNSARKLFQLPRKETGSSLKSIQFPTIRSSQWMGEVPPSPSQRPQVPLFRQDPSSMNFTQIQADEQTRLNQPLVQNDVTTAPSDQNEAGQGQDFTPSSPLSSPSREDVTPPPLKHKHDPIPGFDNETQSDFTQDGHVTAAYIHRQREAGILPDWFTPSPHQIPNWTGRAKDKRKRR